MCNTDQRRTATPAYMQQTGRSDFVRTRRRNRVETWRPERTITVAERYAPLSTAGPYYPVRQGVRVQRVDRCRETRARKIVASQVRPPLHKIRIGNCFLAQSVCKYLILNHSTLCITQSVITKLLTRFAVYCFGIGIQLSGMPVRSSHLGPHSPSL